MRRVKVNHRYAICLLFLPLFSVNVSAAILEDSKLLWIVNSDYMLSPSYRPEDLVNIKGYLIHPETGEAFLKMINDMKSDGINNLRLQSGYRSYGYQKALFNEKVLALCKMDYNFEESKKMAAYSVAPAGASEHQLGLAVDVSINGRLSADFGDTEAGVWLQNNSHDYGFVIRYPVGKTDITKIIYEPWHLRYVGIPHAQYMHEHNMCLEEYIGHLMEAKILIYWLDDKKYYKISFHINDNTLSEMQNSLFSTINSDCNGFVEWELKKFLR